MTKFEFTDKARTFATVLLRRDLKEYTFHNLKHTEQVVKDSQIIATACQLNDDQFNTVILAAWLHDTGYNEGPEEHEMRSTIIAQKLLRELGANEQKIGDVVRTIMATKMPQQPRDIMGKVLCDADLAHLGSKDFQARGNDLRDELSRNHDIHFNTDKDWLKFNLKFLKRHQYFTDFGKNILEKKKKRNMKRLRKMIKNDQNDRKDLEKQIKKLQMKLGKSPKSERGIETMFKTTSSNHASLSVMADNKANIMISINTIVLSVIISMLFNKIEQNPHILIPTVMMVLTCLVTIVFAVLATRPSLVGGTFTREDIQKRKTNLLFFGNFHRTDLRDYEWGMREMMSDSDYLYGSMIKDIYFLGKIVAKKFELLRLSYNIFMFGFVASIIGFILIMIIVYNPYNANFFLQF
jgi:predicted metal-dependent HD superfamily phosphohydrolase